MFWVLFGHYSLKIFIIEYKRMSIHLQSGHKNVYQSVECFLDAFLVSTLWVWSQWEHNYDRDLDLIMIDRPNHRDPLSRLATLLVDVGSKSSSSSLAESNWYTALHWCSPLWAVAQSCRALSFPRQMTLPYQLNTSLLLPQLYLFCCNIDSEEVSVFWDTSSMAKHCWFMPWCSLMNCLSILFYLSNCFFSAKQVIIHGNQYNFL